MPLVTWIIILASSPWLGVNLDVNPSSKIWHLRCILDNRIIFLLHSAAGFATGTPLPRVSPISCRLLGVVLKPAAVATVSSTHRKCVPYRA